MMGLAMSWDRRLGPPKRRLFLVVVISLLLLPLLTQTALAASGNSATASTYSSSSCATVVSSFNAGSYTVYGGGSNVATNLGTVDVIYINPTGGTAQISSSVAVSASGSVCDTTGYPLPSNAPTGTWTLEICKSGTTCTNNGNTVATATFTVNAPVPEFPVGIVGLLLPAAMVYIMFRRRVQIA